VLVVWYYVPLRYYVRPLARDGRFPVVRDRDPAPPSHHGVIPDSPDVNRLHQRLVAARGAVVGSMVGSMVGNVVGNVTDHARTGNEPTPTR
jgi:hypothetical protein